MSTKEKRRGKRILNNKRNESDSNLKYQNRFRRQSNQPNTPDSEESTDTLQNFHSEIKLASKRKKIARNLKKERNDDSRIERQREWKRRRNDRSKNEYTNEELGDKSIEVPITQLLRRAEENEKIQRTRYEEPIPLPVLTTDTLYVQGRNGFSAVKIRNLKNETTSLDRSFEPVHVAVKMHNLWRNVMLFCQGILGGISLSQIILIQINAIQSDSNLSSRIDFTAYPNLVSGIFLFLVTVSLLAAMDRIDIAHLDLEYCREVFSQRFNITVITLPLYLAAICIHLSAVNIDFENPMIWRMTKGSANTTSDEEHSIHRETETWKFILCIIAWFFIALGPKDDLTTARLEATIKYIA